MDLNSIPISTWIFFATTVVAIAHKWRDIENLLKRQDVMERLLETSIAAIRAQVETLKDAHRAEIAAMRDTHNQSNMATQIELVTIREHLKRIEDRLPERRGGRDNQLLTPAL